MPTPFSHIPGISTSLLDGGLRQARTSTQDRVLVLGPASKGPSNELLGVFNTSSIEAKFGADSPVMKKLHEVLSQGADNIRIMRSGGRTGSVVITDSAGGTLTVETLYRDDEILDRYILIIENDASVNRYLVYDTIDSSYVYDSLSVLVLDTGIVEVVDTGLDLFTLNDRADLTSGITLADIVPGDFTVDGIATISTIDQENGEDGTDDSLVEKYAALTTSYHLLDYKDADIVVPAEVYIDDANIADDDAIATYGYYWLGVPVQETAEDKLGFLWQYVYQGKVFTYFTDTVDYFSVTPVAASVTVNTDITITALKDGIGGNACTIQIDVTGAPGPVVTISENTDNGLDILVVDDGSSDTTTTVGAINTQLGLFTTSTGVLADTLLGASGGSAATLVSVVKTNLAAGEGGHALSHAELTGDTVPSAVSTRFAAGADAELRECNFAHQLASFCYLASTKWKMMVGTISSKVPSAFSRSALSTHVGSLPTYTDADTYKFIDAVADNGSGLLGLKLLAGKAATSAGYRSALVTDGDSTDSFAYGGLILTNGASLPNGEKWPYGIDDADEAVDTNAKPVDIGRHIWVSATWLIQNNSFNGGSSYRGSIEASFAGKLAGLPAFKEPIGRINGRIRSVSGVPRIHSAQIDALSELRYVTVRNEDGVGPIFTSVKTSAHPDSDFAKASTIRSVNFVLEGLRRICHGYLGEPLDPQRLAALQSDIDLYLLSTRTDGYHQGARATLRLTRNQKILGKFDVVVRMVPPFAIEAVLIEMSLAADESEL